MFLSSMVHWGLVSLKIFAWSEPAFGIAVIAHMPIVWIAAITTARATPTAMGVPSIKEIFERQIAAGTTNKELNHQVDALRTELHEVRNKLQLKELNESITKKTQDRNDGHAHEDSGQPGA